MFMILMVQYMVILHLLLVILKMVIKHIILVELEEDIERELKKNRI